GSGGAVGTAPPRLACFGQHSWPGAAHRSLALRLLEIMLLFQRLRSALGPGGGSDGRSGASSASGAGKKASRGGAEAAERSLAHETPIALQCSAATAPPRETVVFNLQCVVAGTGEE